MPTYDVECPNCGTYERLVPLDRRHDPCHKCGAQVEILISAATKSKGFEPYFNHGIGEYVTGQGDINKAKREHNLRDREPPRKGDLSARMDKIHERRRAESRR